MLGWLKNTLDHPKIWAAFRQVLESLFGLYSQRTALLNRWDVGRGTVLDVACGTGQFHGITSKGYLGVDLNGDFIKQAQRLHGGPNVEFRQCDVKDLRDEGVAYDTVLLVGILHHLDEETARNLLLTVRGMAKKRLVMMEVVQEQNNVIGRLIKNNDRGEYIRFWPQLSKIIAECGYKLEESRFLQLGPIRTIASLWTPEQVAAASVGDTSAKD